MIRNLRSLLAGPLFFAVGFPLFGVTVNSFYPPLGSPGDQVTVFGSGFYPGTLVVTFNGKIDPTAEATSVDGTVIQAQVPAGASSGPISVSVIGAGFGSSANDFIVIGPGPYITNFTPYVGSPTTRVVVQGVHFTTATNAYFAGKPGVNFFVQSENQFEVYPPPDVVSGPLSVRSPDGSFTSSNFLVAPLITNFSPRTGRANTNVTLSGVNFLGTTNVLFNGLAATFGPPTNNTTLLISIPPGAGTGPIRVNTPAGSSTTASNFVVQPTIFSFFPVAGPVGTSVTIMGANFDVGTPIIRFNGTRATNLTSISFGQLTALVPAGASTGPISITTSDGSHTNSSLFFLPATITSFAPTNSPPGSTVTITGQNLLGVTNVSFNGASTNFTPPVNNTSLQAVVPANVTTGPISVSTPAGTATSSGLFYAAPVITGFSPMTGSPGQNVTIDGSNFLGATAVKFNGVNASFTPPTNNGAIVAVVPTNVQSGNITVVAPAGSSTSSNVFVVNLLSDLSVSLTADPNPVFVGSNLTFTVIITNAGPQTAPNGTMTNYLPSSLIFQSASSSQGALGLNGNLVLGSFGTIGIGVQMTNSIIVTPQSAGTITNTATVASGSSDPIPGNNSVSLTVTVLPLPVLSARLVPPDNLRLSWPVQLTNFVLEFSTDLAPGNSWSSDSTPPAISGGENVVLEMLAGARRYYRLRK